MANSIDVSLKPFLAELVDRTPSSKTGWTKHLRGLVNQWGLGWGGTQRIPRRLTVETRTGIGLIRSVSVPILAGNDKFI